MKIGNGGGFWGDDLEAPLKLVQSVPDLDYLTIDYLAELSLSIMAAQREKNPEKGFAEDFIEVVLSLIPEWQRGSKVKIVTNAGGLNPEGLKTELEKFVKNKKIIAVSGDNVLPLLKKDPANPSYNHLETNEPLTNVSDLLVTAHAYLGAKQIVKALQEGADIVVTGRVADPSMTVGPAVYHYNWQLDDYDKIAQATVAGHLIECGAQVTGGLSRNWLSIKDPWSIAFPYVDIKEDGNFIISQPEYGVGTLDVVAVKEQLLYEIGDPANYLSPDATVSFLNIELKEVGKNRVEVKGARGTLPSPYYKVSATYKAGFKAEGTLLFVGEYSRLKAEKAVEVILKKAPVQEHLVELYGEKETFLRLAASDPDKKALEKFLRQFAPLVTAGPPGTAGYAGGRGKVRTMLGYWPCLIERGQLG